MKIKEKIKNFFKIQEKLPKMIEIKEQEEPIKNEKKQDEKHEEFEWILHGKKDLTVEEVTDIEMLLEDEEEL